MPIFPPGLESRIVIKKGPVVWKGEMAGFLLGILNPGFTEKTP